MELAPTRLRLALGGAVAALAAGGLIAFLMVRSHRGEPAAPPPASQGGLIIDSSNANLGRIDAAKPLRCFVGGRFVGELALPDCARRNGVATDALDVGVDASGALAAGQGGPAPAIVAAAPVVQPAAPAAAPPARASAAAALGDCWRYADKQWRKLPSQTSLNGCAQALFAGRCVQPGAALYGRWDQQTLRLAPGRVEISADNKTFHGLAEQGPGCSIPGVPG